MKISTEPLRSALARLRPIVLSRSTSPLTNMVRLESNGTRLTILATDQDQFQCEYVPCDGSLEPLCLNFNRLDLALGSGAMEFKLVSTTDSGAVMVISYDRTVIKLGVMEAKEFPAPPEDKGKAVGVVSEPLATAIQAVLFCCRPSKDERPQLNCVHIVGKPKELMVESSDAQNGAKHVEAIICEDFEAVIPQGFAANAAAALQREDSQLFLSDKAVRVTHKSGWYWGKQLNMPYLNTSAIYDGTRLDVGTVDVDPLVSELDRCVSFNDNPALVASARLTFGPDGLRFQFREDIDKTLPGAYGAASIRVRADALARCLKALKSEKCHFQIGVAGNISTASFASAGNLLVASGGMRE